jgi:hypothetical protein
MSFLELVIHDIVTDHIGSLCDALPDRFVAHVQALTTARKGNYQYRSKEKKKVFAFQQVNGPFFLLLELNFWSRIEYTERKGELCALLPSAQQAETAHEFVQRNAVDLIEIETVKEVGKQFLTKTSVNLSGTFQSRAYFLHALHKRLHVNVDRSLLNLHTSPLFSDGSRQSVPQFIRGHGQQSQLLDDCSNIGRVFFQNNERAAI